jgi:alpha-glucosidase
MNAADAANQLELKLMENEAWWGGFTTLSPGMPFKGKVKPTSLLNQNKGNQAVPLLLSNRGRWIWSEEPFTFALNKGKISITDGLGKIESGSAGDTLREAYLHVSKTYFPPSGKVVEPLMLEKPQYNTWIQLTYNQNQKDILAYAHAIVDNGFPTGV